MKRTALSLLLTLSFAGASGAQVPYDLLIKGGHVIDPKNGIDAVRDVAIKEGRIAAVAGPSSCSDRARPESGTPKPPAP